MTDKPRCSQCHDTKPLGPSGVCRWRHGCEHRQMVSEARLLREVEAIIEDAAVWRPSPSSYTGERLVDYWRHPSSQANLGDFMNKWVDGFLGRQERRNDDPDDGYSPR